MCSNIPISHPPIGEQQRARVSSMKYFRLIYAARYDADDIARQHLADDRNCRDAREPLYGRKSCTALASIFLMQ